MATRPRGRALHEAQLEEVRLGDVLERVGLLVERGGERRHTDRTAAELLDDRPDERDVHLVEAELVDLEDGQRLACDGHVDVSVAAHLGEIPDPAQEPVRDARGSAGASRDLLRAGARRSRRRGGSRSGGR